MAVSLRDLQQTYAAKDTEDLLSLHKRGTLTEIACEALEAELIRRNVAVPPRTDPGVELAAAQEAHRRMTLSAHWKGDAPLASAYWLIGTLGFWLSYGAFLLASQFARLLAAVAAAWLLAVIVFGWVSIWRCWKNSRWLGWGYIARAMVIINVVVVAALAVSVAYQVTALR